MRTPGRTARIAFLATIVATVAACGGGAAATPDQSNSIGPAGSTRQAHASPTTAAEPTAAQLALVDPASLPRELTFFDHKTAIFIGVVVDPLDRDYGHVTIAIDGVGVAWSLEPGSIENRETSLAYSMSGPARLDRGAMPDTLHGPNFSLSGVIEDATLNVDVAVEQDLVTATATIVLNGTTYVFTAEGPEMNAGAVAETANAALVAGDWQSIWDNLEADGQARFTPEHWIELGKAFESEFDSIDSAELVGVRYLVQPGVLPFRAFVDTIVFTTSNGVQSRWEATEKLIYERGAWRIESMGQMKETR